MRKYSLWLVFGLIVLVMGACGSAEDKGTQNDNSNEKSETVTIEHELGTTEVPKKPEKVVVFDFGILDTLDKLGIEVAGLPQATIPSYLDKYASDDYENVGSLKEPDFEKIAEIDPDLIIISARQASLYEQFQEITEATIDLSVDTTQYMDSFKENMVTIGEIFDKESEIEEELSQIEDSISTLHEKAETSEKDALIILANDDKISAYGPSSRFGLIHDVFGVKATDENIEASTHGKNVSFEYVKEQNPNLLYVIDRGAAIGGESSAKTIVENQLVENTNAYKNDDIVYLNADYWYLSGGGLISVQEMINEVDASLE
ncbi:MAG TPA: siderophore ABC transporter substrate-binding protein [Candidatus Avamphibacillus sp.]|nr:siderophore ABC transporter substrate-binding protein [Candidatus Avamphibacillus sp.]